MGITGGSCIASNQLVMDTWSGWTGCRLGQYFLSWLILLAHLTIQLTALFSLVSMFCRGSALLETGLTGGRCIAINRLVMDTWSRLDWTWTWSVFLVSTDLVVHLKNTKAGRGMPTIWWMDWFILTILIYNYLDGFVSSLTLLTTTIVWRSLI